MSRIFILGGLFGPLIFTTITIVAGGLRPDYNHLDQFISELGATGTPNAALMNYAGFILAGLLIALFGVSLMKSVVENLGSGMGAALIIVFGLGMTAAGIFSCDPGCISGGSQQAAVHDGVSAFIFMAVILGVLLLGISFRRMADWRGIWVYSVGTSVALTAVLILMISTIETKILTGLWQRLYLLILFVWMVVTGLRAYRKYGE